ncbi:DUF3841 domain-containing protein [Paenibacillus sp. L3-i20]|uniref:DUF3841 domain-containing protein n=1 Tax=Paenibacillus sp. L3-i20 TaxID=2905833 RepID=UPI001EDDE817|nr:DUF3841 domain-containing protein [Paenibacillus sp. L3-i20]GKU78758.1 hypothetical protein L3i20_v231550 [Paenibacillus sp. L3-i20]
MTTYWTLQTEEVWNKAINLGYLEGSEQFAMFPEQYQWMIDQMVHRLPGFHGEYPVWLWIEKPDMRSTGHFSSFTRCVRLKLDLEEDHVLLSDFDDWHMVLNNSFNADNEIEYDDFYNNKLDITKEQSWERIFELSRVRDPEWHGLSPRLLQGTTGRIDISSVKKVEHFVSRKQSEF